MWKRLDEILAQRPAAYDHILKVKAHASWKDVADGSTTTEDKLGNDAADALAVAGAVAHAVDPALLHDFQWRLATAQAVQAMMLDILEARRNYPKRSPT